MSLAVYNGPEENCFDKTIKLTPPSPEIRLEPDRCVAHQGCPEIQIEVDSDFTVQASAITLVPFSIGALGVIYFLGAVILGVYFLVLALRLWRNGETYKPLAKKLYHFSNAYLALLFLAMVVDHWLPTWRV